MLDGGDIGISTRRAQDVFAGYINAVAERRTHLLRSDAAWMHEFRREGKHLVEVLGWLEDVRTGPKVGDVLTVPHGGLQKVTNARFLSREVFEQPAHLYRAAKPGRENNLMWFDRFDMAKLIADDVGGMTIYTAEADEVFAKVVMDRTEPGGHREVWSEWIVKPKNVRPISRHVDPFKPIANLDEWEKRGVHALHAASLVGQWFRATSSHAAPMDREQGGYWLSQFKDLGQFEAHSSWDSARKDVLATNTVTPAVEMQAPAKLYRGAPDKTKARWSWTAEPETAQWFIDMFCPDDGVIWECEAHTVYGVINAHVSNPEPGHPAEFSEWIVHPDETTIKKWQPAP